MHFFVDICKSLDIFTNLMEYRLLCAKEGCRKEKVPGEVCPVCGSTSCILRINDSYEIEIGHIHQGDLPSLLEELDRVNGILDNGKYLGGPNL